MQNSVNTKEQAILIPGTAGQLEARIGGISPQEPNPPQKIGIVCHPHPLHQGTMDNKIVTTIVRAFQELGLATLRFNFRGVGASDGKYGEGIGEVEDLQSVIQWVRNQKPQAKLFLAGFSFGSAIAAKVALEGDFEGLICVGPPIQYFETVLSITCPWLIIHGEEDELFPISEVNDYYNQAKAKGGMLDLIIIPGASHFFHGKLLSLKNHIQEWMQS